MSKKVNKFKWSEIKAALKEVQSHLANGNISAGEFNMNVAAIESCSINGGECGTIGCIGGHVGMYLGLSSESAMDFVYEADAREALASELEFMTKATAKRLSPLFYPDDEGLEWERFTPGQAVLAIERFLNGSKKPWKGML